MDENLAARFRALTPEAVLNSHDNIVSNNAPEEATPDKKAPKRQSAKARNAAKGAGMIVIAPLT